MCKSLFVCFANFLIKYEFKRNRAMLDRMVLTLALLIVFLTHNVVHAQDIKIVYEMKQGNLGGLPYEELNPIPDFSILAKRYSLVLSGDKSRFSVDSLMLKYASKTGSYKGRYTSEVSYKNFSDGTSVYVTGNMIEGYGILGKLNVIGQERTCRFTLEPEYRVIAGFKCQKSVSCKGSEAWFTTEIPYVDSPLEAGIPAPGLVLLYRNKDYEIKAIDVSTGDYDFEVPTLKYPDPDDRASAFRTIEERKNMGPDEAIIVNKESLTGVWLKFPQ